MPSVTLSSRRHSAYHRYPTQHRPLLTYVRQIINQAKLLQLLIQVVFLILRRVADRQDTGLDVNW